MVGRATRQTRQTTRDGDRDRAPIYASRPETTTLEVRFDIALGSTIVAAPTKPELEVGRVLASKYRLEELLGSGGMGHVYRALNVEIERPVAIKVLRAEHAQNAPIVERFLREARAANLVRHPNVVDVVDIGRDGDGSPFIVQELLEGEDLAKYVEGRGGRLSLAEITEYLLPVVDAVAAAHARGVVHRDLKPENVFLAQTGHRRIPKLLDFGISKLRLPNIKVTEVGTMMGTPAYMAPEQVQGSRDADPRTDVWALGVMLFELLSGTLPFQAADAPALFVAIATTDAPALLDVSPESDAAVSRVVDRCLRRLPDERYPTALELARDLRHVVGGESIEDTQLRAVPSLTVSRAPTPPLLEVPELDLPPRPASPRSVVPVAPTLPGPPSSFATSKTELLAPVSAAPSSVPDLPVPPRSTPRLSAPASSLPPASHSSPPSTPQFPATSVAPPSRPAPQAPPPSRPAPHAPPPGHAGRLAGDQVLPGVMLAGSSTSTQRRPTTNAYLPEPARPPPAPDMGLLVALAVVGLTSIGSSAVLMTFAHRPEGWPLLALVTKPTAVLELAVQGGLGVVAFVLAARSAAQGVKKWRGFAEGGRGAAVVSAVLAGAFFFAALQLARAAW